MQTGGVATCHLDQSGFEDEVVGRPTGAGFLLFVHDLSNAGPDRLGQGLGHQANLGEHDNRRLVDLTQVVEVVVIGLRRRGRRAERKPE